MSTQQLSETGIKSAVDPRDVDGNDHRRIPAWLMSFSLHAIILVMLILFVRGAVPGAPVVDQRSVGLVLVDADTQEAEFESEGENSDSTQSSVPESATALPNETELPPDLPGPQFNAPSVSSLGDLSSLSQPSAGDLIAGNDAGGSSSGATTTEVFGIRGTGSRFVYVFDRSASMEEYNGRPLQAAKSQLIGSLQKLGSVHQFQVMFYNDAPKVFNPSGRRKIGLLFATEENRQLAVRFVNSIQGTGGTDHIKALKLALSYSPDVIFLLTDAEGGFSRQQLGELQRLNRNGSVIHTIEFGSGPKTGTDRSLEELAGDHRGQYTYKDVWSLGKKR